MTEAGSDAGLPAQATMQPWTLDRRWLATLAVAVPAAAALATRAPARNIAPLVIPARKGVAAHLVTVGRPGTRLRLKGVNVWGITDYITRQFSLAQYADRNAICATIAAWGGNHIRLRVLADEYMNPTHLGSKANYLRWVRDWVAAAKAHGLYTYISWWDARDSQSHTNNGVHWATRYGFAFPMMSAVYRTLRMRNGQDDPYVFYEPFNEPSAVSWEQWFPAMRATVQHWRSLGYQGLLVIDTPNFSHEYSEKQLTALEAIDSKLTRRRRHNLAFARHDYCTDYPGYRFSPQRWLAASGGFNSRHVLIESEFGNANGPSSSIAWSREIAAYFKGHFFARPNMGGMSAFLFGNWYDANAMSTDPVGAHPTAWGSAVRNLLG